MQQEAEKTVDIDTSGPGADIEIKEEWNSIFGEGK